MHRWTECLVALELLCASWPSLAHHSYLQYGQEIREVRGELLSLSWQNPHPQLTIRSFDSSGREVLWHLESFSSPYVLSRMGVTRDDFVIGSNVTVAGRLSRRSANEMLLTHLLRADGTEVITTPAGEPFWADAPVGGSANWTEATVAADKDAGLFRVWSLDRIGRGATNYSFTPEALAARASFDEASSYVENCEQPGMPTAMMAAFPFELSDAGDRIVLRTQYHDVERTIHMKPGDASAVPPSKLGYSVGHWEDGGRTLVVETTRIDWPWFDIIGTPQSAAVEVSERFALNDDGVSLSYHRTVEDPATFTEPASSESTYLALGEAIQVFDCISAR
jgi:hypothetical protein